MGHETMRRGKAPLAALLALSCLAAFAATPARNAAIRGEPLFSALGTRDGLPNASVSSIVQDGQCFLWFGTQGGLARYDGYSFKVFRHEPFDEGSLPHDLVQTLYLDGDSLWVGSYGGLARLDLRSERFTSYANDPARPDSLSNNVVTSIARDSRGRLWVGTLDGLNRLDGAGGGFRRFLHDPADPKSLPCDVVRAILPDRSGRLWIGSSGGGLSRFDYESEGFQSYRKGGPSDGSIISDYVMSIAEDSAGSLWVGSWYGGLSRFDPASGRFENHPMDDDRVYVLNADEEGSVYVGTWGGGLFEYDARKGGFQGYRASGSSGTLSSDVVYSLFRDVSGELWIGTNGGGLCKLGASRRSYEAISASSDGLPPGKVYAVLLDRLGYLWVGVYNEGLARRDPRTGAWRRYSRRAGDPRSLPNDIVNFLYEDEGGSVWAGTNDGLARYDRSGDCFETLRPVAGRGESLSSEIIYAMATDPPGEGPAGAWIGTFNTGLDYWDRAKGVFRHFRNDPSRGDSLSADLVTAIGRDSKDRLWIGTNRGLNRLESAPSSSAGVARGGGSFVRYLYDPSRKGGISSDSIRTIFLDSGRVLWIGTAGGGVMRYEPETDSFVSYTTNDGLPSNTVLRILEDGDGNLWIATQLGLVVYDRTAGKFRDLSVLSDLNSAEFFSGAFKSPDGALYFGALDRIYRFEPARYTFNSHRPPVALTAIRPMDEAPIGAAAASALPRLELSWKRNSVVFEFSALDYRDPERNRYSYRLEGFDEAWSPAGTGRAATYTQLPGGDYGFRVRASNNDGLWNEEGLTLRVHVGCNPWTSPWAHVLYAVFLAAGGAALGFLLSRSTIRALGSEAAGLRARLVAASVSMESAAIVDQLTGLPNRRKVEEHLELAMSKAASRKLDLAVLMVDIDNFKQYNDRHGRAAGDECLCRVAEALASCLKRSSDVAARFGGEEFLVVLEETDIEGALAEGESARRAVEELGMPADGGRPGEVLTVSVGCASIQPDAGQSPAVLLAAAERALVAAKQRGRNRISE